MVMFWANIKFPPIRHYWRIIKDAMALTKHTEMVSYQAYTNKNTDYTHTYGLKSCNLRQNFSSESSLGQLTCVSQRSLPSMQAPSPQVNCHSEHFPAILTVEWVICRSGHKNISHKNILSSCSEQHLDWMRISITSYASCLNVNSVINTGELSKDHTFMYKLHDILRASHSCSTAPPPT
jgi:hypothetical protein